MKQPLPYFREAGSGPGVVCLHANASTSGQWRGLMDRLAPDYHVLAPDLYGAGRTPAWPHPAGPALADEAALIEPALERAGAPLVLAGHSYGAAVALIAALAQPARVRALILYEPTLFALINPGGGFTSATDGIRHAVEAACAALDRDEHDTAAGHFIDYWMGGESWARMPPERRAPIAASIVHIRRWGQALFTEPTPLNAFRQLSMPVLYLAGKRTTAAAQAVTGVLAPVLPHCQFIELDGLGHMGPVTHPERVNDAIATFLASL